MRFFTIDTDKHLGIDLTKVGDSYWIVCGKDEAAVGIQASPYVSAGIDLSEKQTDQKVKQFFSGEIVRKDDTGEAVLSPDYQDEEEERRRNHGHPLREPVLLMVKVPANAKLTQAAYDEEVIDGEVVHHYHPFEHDVAPPGVTVWLSSGDQWLLELAPNAAFRIAYPTMSISVRWTGIRDRVEWKNGERVVRKDEGLVIRQFEEGRRNRRRARA